MLAALNMSGCVIFFSKHIYISCLASAIAPQRALNRVHYRLSLLPADSHGVPREMRAHAVLLQQRQAVQLEIDGTEEMEQQLALALTREAGSASDNGPGNTADKQGNKENVEAMGDTGGLDRRSEEECSGGTGDDGQAILGENQKTKGVKETTDDGRRGGGGDSKLGAALNGDSTSLSDEQKDPSAASSDVVAINADDSPRFVFL